MRLTLLFAIFAVLGLAFETAIPHLISFRALIPNLMVILAVDLGFRHYSAGAAMLAFAIGYATDTFSGSQPGINAFTTTLVFLISYEISSRLLVTNAAVGATVVFFGVMFTAILSILISAGSAALESAGAMLPDLLLHAGISALCAPMIFTMLAGAKRMVGLPAVAARE